MSTSSSARDSALRSTAGASEATSSALAFSRTQRASTETGELAGREAGITEIARGFDGGVKRRSLTSPRRPMTIETNVQFKRLVPTSPALWENATLGERLDPSRRAGRPY